jgi:Mce-associated membrane protein
VDVADLRAADVTAGRRRRIALVVAAYVVLVGLIASTVFFALRLQSRVSRDNDRDAALAAARQQAVNFLSIDYRTAERDLQRIVDNATGDVEQAYREQLKAFPTVLRQSKSVSTGEVVAAGVQSFNRHHAVVALAVNQSIHSDETKRTVNTARRMVLDLRFLKGHWRTDKQTFVGIGVLV